MKKHSLWILIVAAVSVAITLFTAGAATPYEQNGIYAQAVQMTKDGTFNPGGTLSANCPHCGETVSWEPLTSTDNTMHLQNDKHYYLASDVNNGSYYHIYDNVCLHLNGHSITSSARAIYVETNATLNIMGDGIITGKGLSHTTCDRGSAVDNCGTLNLHGGTYKHVGSYPVIASRSSKGGINIYDGTLVQGTSGLRGNNIRVHLSYLNIYGGVIEDGIADQGGNIYGGQSARITIAGGTVTGGTVYMSDASTSLTLSGAPKVDVINLFDGPKANISGLTEGADIQIVGQGALTETRSDMDKYADFFHSPNELVKLSVKDGALFGTVDTTADSTAPLSDGKTLKLLCLTSSFGLNTTELLYDIAVAEGFEEVIVARLYASGCTLKEHVDAYNDDSGIYWYTKFTKDGKEELDDAKMLDGLLDEDWDIIFIQQGAEQTGQLNTYVDYLDQLMDIVNQHKTNSNAKFIWNMTWAFQWDNTRKVFTGTFQNSQLYMHEKIIDAMQEKILTRSDFCALIPTGAAVQNARSSYFGDRLTKDTLHLNNLGRVIAGYTVLATVLDKDITEVNVGSVKSYDLTTPIRLSETDRQVVIESVANARKDPFSLFQSKYTPEYLNSIGDKAKKLSFTGSSNVSAECPYCEKVVSWKPLTEDTSHVLETTDGTWGHYYLAEDITYSSQYMAVNEVDNGHSGFCLHLNNKTIKNTGKRGFWIGAGNTLNIMGDGVIRGIGEGAEESNWRGAALDVYGHVNIFGGTITNDAAIPAVMARGSSSRVNLFDGGIIQGNPDYTVSAILLRNAGAEFNMWGGTVEGNQAANGASIRITAKATFNMFGGTMQDGYSTSIGGNVYATNGTVNMYGGLITGGAAENSSSSYGRGGNVALNGSSSAKPAFYMYGGTIGGTAEEGKTPGYASIGGANLYVAYGTATINGKNATISNGNGKLYGGNVMVSTSATLTLMNGTITAGESNLGGNIYLAGTSSDLVVSGGTVHEGRATTSGGNLYLNNGNTTICGGTFTGGEATSGDNLYLKTGNTSSSNTVTIDHDDSLSATAPVLEGGSIYINYNATLGKFTTSDTKTPTVEIAKNAKLTILPSFSEELHATVAEELLGTPVYGSTVKNGTTQGKFSGKIYLNGYKDAPYLYGVEGDTQLYVTGTALVAKDGTKVWYENADNAVADYDANTAWLQAGPGALNLTGKDYMIDIAGQTVSLNGSGNVSCFDSSNDDYSGYGTATLNGPTLTHTALTKANGNEYIALQNDGAWSFHRLEMGIHSIGLRPSIAGIYFNSAWRMDDVLSAELDTFGVAVSLSGAPTLELMNSGKVMWTEFSAEDLNNGADITGVMIANIVKEAANNNDQCAKTPIFGATYLTLKDGTMLISDNSVSYSLYDVIAVIDEQIADLSAHKQTVVDFLAHWRSFGLTGEEWTFDFEG